MNRVSELLVGILAIVSLTIMMGFVIYTAYTLAYAVGTKILIILMGIGGIVGAILMIMDVIQDYIEYEE